MTEAFEQAMRLLTRREHGQQELIQKLLRKGHTLNDAEQALAECQRLGYQDEKRFIDMSIKARMQQGYGPIRIVQELRNKQADDLIIEESMEAYSSDQWNERAKDVFEKKYRFKSDVSPKERQKQQQFLLYRGFSLDTIKWVMRHEECQN